MRAPWLCLVLLLVPQYLWAVENIEEPSLFTSALKMVAALGVIIGLLLLCYAASRKGFGVLPKQRGEAIKVLETRPLGGRKFLCLVSVRGQEMLLGVSNERIESLAQLPTQNNFSQTLQDQLTEESG